MIEDTLEDSLRMAELLMGQAVVCLEDQRYAPRTGTSPRYCDAVWRICESQAASRSGAPSSGKVERTG